MKLFGQIIRTAVNVVKLPVCLPVAVAKDTLDVLCGEEAEHTAKVVKELKRDAEED